MSSSHLYDAYLLKVCMQGAHISMEQKNETHLLSNLNLKVDNNFCICFDILILWKNPNSCNFINLFFQID